MNNMVLSSERSVLEHEIALQNAYDYALIQMRKEIDAFFQKYAKENKITYAEARRRLNVTERKDFNSLLREWYKVAHENGLSKEYKEHLNSLGNRVYITRLETISEALRYQIEQLKSNQFMWMTDLMASNYVAGYYSSYYIVAQGLEVSVNFATIDRTGVEKAVKTRWDGRNYSDSVWNDKQALIKSMSTILPRSFSMGINSKDLGDMIAKELKVSKNRGQALARTEINFLCNQATLDVYKACNIKEYEYLATLDMRTSDICRGMDGTIHKVSLAKVGVNYPPMHVRCRSTTIPYFADDDTLDRIARDEEGNNIKVPRRMSQESWIKQYVPKDQQESLLRFLSKFSADE